MRRVLATAIFILACWSGTSRADSPAADACRRAVTAYLISDTVSVSAVQDFSNLRPPRVRMRLGDLLSTTVSCVFSSATKPVGLREFCYDIACFKKGNARFDEIAEILRRGGY